MVFVAKGEKPTTPETKPAEQGDMVKSLNANMIVNGKASSFGACNIADNNYFKLRDLGQAVDFAIGWDDVTSTITVDTTKGYTA